MFVVVTGGKEVFPCRDFGSFAEVFGELVDDVAGVHLHAKGHLVGESVVDVYA